MSFLADEASAAAAAPSEQRHVTSFVHQMPFGAQVLANGETRFRLWAPSCPKVHVAVEGLPTPVPMAALADGWHEVRTACALQRARTPS